MERDDRTTRTPPPDTDPSAVADDAGRGRPGGLRWLVAALVVAAWIVIGFAFGLGANAYLLLSIPFVVGFQLLVARAPLRAVWLRSAPRFTWDLRTIPVFLVLAVVPAYTAVVSARAADGVGVLYGLAAVGGAAGVAYAGRAVRRVTLRQLALCVVVVCVISTLIDLVSRASTSGAHPGAPAGGPLAGLYWFLLYLPALFVVEEVFFRGVLDSYLHRPQDGPGWLSAVYVSALWGLWHLPIVLTAATSSSAVAVAIGLLIVQILLGVPLSVGWRRSGNLLVPSAAHALSDAIRNVLIGVP